MKKFDINLAKQGKPVCTRDGRKARIICFDAKSVRPILALIDNEDDEHTYAYLPSGKILEHKDCGEDLMMATETHEGWINLYRSKVDNSVCTCGPTYTTKEEAIKYSKNLVYYIATVKIEWEE